MLPSEVIQAAIDHPSYLTTDKYLCNVVYDMELDPVIEKQTHKVIREALEGNATLALALWRHNLLNEGLDQSSSQYRELAFAFWNNLIAQLKSRGQ